MNVFLGVLAILAIIAVVAVITALAIGEIVRDKKRHGTSGTLSTAALEMQSLLEPGKKRVVEAMHEVEERAASDESGED